MPKYKPPESFDFPKYKRTILTAYQTTDWKEGFRKLQFDFQRWTGRELPKPIWKYQEDLELIYTTLDNHILENNLFYLEYISKDKAKKEYGFSERMFELFYPEPDKKVKIQDAKEKYRKTNVFAYLYNKNKLVAPITKPL